MLAHLPNLLSILRVLLVLPVLLSIHRDGDGVSATTLLLLLAAVITLFVIKSRREKNLITTKTPK